MSESTASQFIIGALIFTAIVGGCFMYISGFASDNSDFKEYNRTFAKFDDINAKTADMQEKIQDAEPASGVLGILNGLIQSSWGAIKTIWSSVTIMSTLITDLADSFGVPLWFINMMIAITGIGIVFALMAAWFQWRI